MRISIHALLAESDLRKRDTPSQNAYFYPRSPCGERRAPPYNLMIQHRFLSTLSLRRATLWVLRKVPILGIFLSTLSLRRATLSTAVIPILRGFLSTLSLRRATNERCKLNRNNGISIHALLAESDHAPSHSLYLRNRFLSTLSLRRATFVKIMSVLSGLFLSTLSLRRATRPLQRYLSMSLFLSTLSLRRATSRRALGFVDPDISIHALLAESDSSGNS